MRDNLLTRQQHHPSHQINVVKFNVFFFCSFLCIYFVALVVYDYVRGMSIMSLKLDLFFTYLSNIIVKIAKIDNRPA